MEIRTASLSFTGKALVGYASVYNSRSQDLGGFVEMVSPGAFDSAIQGKVDVIALWNHDTSKPLGRRSNGALTLRSDGKGLAVEIVPPDDVTYAEDLKRLIARGDVKQMSFGFTVPKGGDSWERDGGMPVRTLNRVDLIEVSPVSLPAYEDTTIALRGLREFRSRERAEWLLRFGSPDYRALKLAMQS